MRGFGVTLEEASEAFKSISGCNHCHEKVFAVPQVLSQPQLHMRREPSPEVIAWATRLWDEQHGSKGCDNSAFLAL